MSRRMSRRRPESAAGSGKSALTPGRAPHRIPARGPAIRRAGKPMASTTVQRSRGSAAARLLKRARPILGLEAICLLRVEPRTRLLRLVEAVGLPAAARAALDECRPRTVEELLAGPWSAGLAATAVPVRFGHRGTGCLIGFTRRPGGDGGGRAGTGGDVWGPAGPGGDGGGRAGTGGGRGDARPAAPAPLDLGFAAPDPRGLRVLAEALGHHLGGPGAPVRRRGLQLLEHLRIFYRVSVLAAARSGAGEVGGRVLREFCAALRLTRGEIWILDGRGWMRRLCAHGAVPEANGGDDPAPRDFAFTRRLLRRRQPLLVDDAGRRPAGPYTHLAWPGLRSLYGVPLRRHGRLIGFLLADQGGRPIEMSSADRQLAAALTGLIAEVVDGALAREVERKRHRQLDLLNRANQAIDTGESPEGLLPSLTRLVRETERCRGVVIGLYETRRREIAVKAISGRGGRRFLTYRFPVRRSQPASCLGSQAFMRQRPVRVEDASHLPRTSLYWPESRSVLVIPIRGRDRTLGVLRLEALPPRSFDEKDAEVYSILGEQIGHALERARALADFRTKQADLRRVSENLEAMLEEDRRRLARELQEELAQAMTAAKLTLAVARDLAGGSHPDLEAGLREVDLVLDQAIEKTRRIAADLRPVLLDELGLMPTLRWYTDAFRRRTGIRVFVRTQGEEPVVPPAGATLLFRFVQEALGQVERAATARRALVSVGGGGDGLRLVVWDDGRVSGRAGGRDGDPVLLALRERIERAGGVLQVDARAGLGTRLVATMPLEPPPGGRPRTRRHGGPETAPRAGEVVA
jgi:signal transduction histidine kinase